MDTYFCCLIFSVILAMILLAKVIHVDIMKNISISSNQTNTTYIPDECTQISSTAINKYRFTNKLDNKFYENTEIKQKTNKEKEVRAFEMEATDRTYINEVKENSDEKMQEFENKMQHQIDRHEQTLEEYAFNITQAQHQMTRFMDKSEIKFQKIKKDIKYIRKTTTVVQDNTINLRNELKSIISVELNNLISSYGKIISF